MKIKCLLGLLAMVFMLSRAAAQTDTTRKAVNVKKTMSTEKVIQFKIDSIKKGQKITARPKPTSPDTVRMKRFITDSLFSNSDIRTLQQKSLLITRRKELDHLLGTQDDSLFVTPSNYNQIIKSKFRTLSGTQIKAGKYMGNSVSVDSKSITVNISLKPFKNSEIYLLPTIAGSSSNGFVNVITGNKYSRTVTGGTNFILLGHNNKSRYDAMVSRSLHNDLKILKLKYKLKPNSDSAYYTSALKQVRRVLIHSGIFISNYYTGKVDTGKLNLPATDTATYHKWLADLALYQKAVDTLVKVKLLPKDFNKQTLGNQDTLAYHALIQPKTVSDLALGNYLDQADQIQQKAGFRESTVSWLGGGIKYNQANYNIADGAVTALERGIMDEYISASLSYTWMFIHSNGNHIYLSPTFNYQNNHNFSTSNQLHVEVLQNYPIGTTTAQKVAKDLTIYPGVPGRLATNYLDVPFAYYNNKWGVGAEIDVKYGYNDANDDNRDISLGILIPLNQSANNVLIIEPLAKAQKLNQTITNFWQNNFVMGVNVSISIPSSFFK
jgi:hypothetical protein